jgi:hypothetical protein
MVVVGSTTPYQHYKFIVDSVKVPGNIMQFADIEFYAASGDLGSGFLDVNDPIIAVDGVPTPAGWKACGTPNTDCSNSPGGEQPPLALDQVGNPGPPPSGTTKYLNFGEQNSGIVITNSEGSVDVNFMRFRTANDAPERDPATYRLEGTNDNVSGIAPNSPGTADGVTWNFISEGTLSLPTERHTWDDEFVAVNSSQNYTSYRLVFPTTRSDTANSMQIADIQFYTAIPEPATASLVALAGLALAACSRRRVA